MIRALSSGPILGAVGLCVLVAAIAAAAAESNEPAAFAGTAACAGCHKSEYELWRGSHHDLAMQVANAETVLGDFDDAEFVHQGITSRFFRRDGRFFVNTEDATGKMRDFEISYTFGVEPLQQYLVAFPDGSLQALGIVWDTRAKDAGGQRWFHVYGDEPIPAGDELHWTQRSQTWNYMCADCHSTGLRKGYDQKTKRYATTWAEINVGCESCHGPGSAHVAWAASPHDVETSDDKGLTNPLGDHDGGVWSRATDERIAQRSVARTTQREINTCARCHSRRQQLSDTPFHGQSLFDGYDPAILSARLYHADGQIDDEVYVWGSFVQSRMYQAGVTCGDCHEPHSLKTRADDNSLCTRCHAPAVFDEPAHHFHAEGTAAARCISCHMPTKNYMQIDARRDHSMRIPRPDLSVTLGTPNACNECHNDKSPQWAAAAIKERRGADYHPKPHYGETLDAGRRGVAGADIGLAALAADLAVPAIVRASALELLAAYPGEPALRALTTAMQDEDPLPRLAAIGLLGGAPLELRTQFALPETYDDLLAVRVAAARVLAALPLDRLPPARAAELEARFDEYVTSERFNADHPASNMNLGNFFTDRGDYAAAENAYRDALALDPGFIGALVNLADLYRRQQRDGEAEKLLLTAAEQAPDNADVQHALGLLYVRIQNQDAALAAFERAARLRPADPRLSYVYSIALNSYGRGAEAVDVLRNAITLHPRDPTLLMTLATLYRDQGETDAALQIAERLVTLNPQDAQARALRDSLQKSRP